MTGLLTSVFEPGFFASAPVHVGAARRRRRRGRVRCRGVVHRHARPVLRRPLAGRYRDRRRLGGVPASGINPLCGFVADERARGGGDGADRASAPAGTRPGHRDRARCARSDWRHFSSTWTPRHRARPGRPSTCSSGRSSPSSVVDWSRSSSSSASLRSALVLVVYRPLLLTSISPDLAAAQGLPGPPRRHRATSSRWRWPCRSPRVTIGAILSTALLIGPAATALRLTNGPATRR